MLVQVKKWGNSASIRIPASIMASSALSLDQMVDMVSEDGCIVIKPVVAQDIDLDTLLAGMSPDTFHDDLNTGCPVGNEVW